MTAVDLRPALLALELVTGSAAEQAAAAGDELAAEVLAAHWPAAPPVGAATLRLRGAFGTQEDGQGLLGPELLAEMLSACAGRQLHVLQVHRLTIGTRDSPLAPADAISQAAAAVAAAQTAAQRAERMALAEVAAAALWRAAGAKAAAPGEQGTRRRLSSRFMMGSTPDLARAPAS